MIDKACEYLRTHLWQNVDAYNDPIVESVRNTLVSASWDNVEELIKDFEKKRWRSNYETMG